MSKWILALALLFAVSLPALAADKKQEKGGNAVDQVKALTMQNRDAALKADTNWMQQHLDPGYVSVSPTGAVSDREQVIQNVKSGAMKYDAIDVSDQKVHVFGNTAVVDTEAHVKATSNGQPVDGDFRATHVWVKEGDTWKLVSFQATPVQASTSATEKK